MCDGQCCNEVRGGGTREGVDLAECRVSSLCVVECARRSHAVHRRTEKGGWARVTAVGEGRQRDGIHGSHRCYAEDLPFLHARPHTDDTPAEQGCR